MSRGRLLVLFFAAGLILAVVLGVYFYRSNLSPDQDDVNALLQRFTECISSGDYESARQMMTEETRSLLRDPGTVLGETVYRELKLKSVDKVYREETGGYAADVILTGPDTLKIMTKAGILFGEKVAAEGPADDPDQMLAGIYAEILARDDIPMLDNFLIIRMENRGGQLLIHGDKTLQQALEGNISTNSVLTGSAGNQ